MFSATTARRPMSRIVLATSRSNHHTSLMVVVPVFSISIACIIAGQYTSSGRMYLRWSGIARVKRPPDSFGGSSVSPLLNAPMRWLCEFTKPGNTAWPSASIVLSACNVWTTSSRGQTATIRAPSMATAPFSMESRRPSTGITQPLSISSFIGLSPCARLETQICGLDVLVVDQLLPTLQNDLAGLQHVGMVGELEAVMDVLLDEKNGDPALVQPFDNLEHVRDDERSQSQTRLVQHDETRAAHERPAQRQHLTLAARQRARGLALTLTEDRKQLEDLSASLIHTRPGPTAV